MTARRALLLFGLVLCNPRISSAIAHASPAQLHNKPICFSKRRAIWCPAKVPELEVASAFRSPFTQATSAASKWEQRVDDPRWDARAGLPASAAFRHDQRAPACLDVGPAAAGGQEDSASVRPEELQAGPESRLLEGPRRHRCWRRRGGPVSSPPRWRRSGGPVQGRAAEPSRSRLGLLPGLRRCPQPAQDAARRGGGQARVCALPTTGHAGGHTLYAWK